MRTLNSVGFENQTLVQIGETIAAKYNLTLVTATGLENVCLHSGDANPRKRP